MTTYDLDTLALAYAGEEADDESRLAHTALFLNAYNEAYFFVCNAVLRPEAREAVTLDGDARFDPAALSHGLAPGGVLAVARGEGRPEQLLLFSVCGDGRIAVHGAAGGAQVFVAYRRRPDVLINDTPLTPGSGSEPALLTREFHGALACYAAAVFFRTRRKFERMQVWMGAWAEAVDRIRGQAGPPAARLMGVCRRMP